MKTAHLKKLLTAGESKNFVEQVHLAFKITEEISRQGGRAFFVGGIVRDILRKKRNPQVHLKDIDIEVYGLAEKKLMDILSGFGKPLTVGVSFAVIKLNGIDISLPRKDKKTGKGHKGFEVIADPALAYREASRRRSFSINSMLLDPLSGKIIDPFKGKRDLRKKILRVVDPNTFTEDSLRVLRGMQFVARFKLKIDKQTLNMCKSTPLDDLSPERIGEEWMKLLMLSKKPSIGLDAALEMGIIEKLHPHLYAMIGTKQEPEWHPEGDLWEHTKNCVDEMAMIIRRESLDEHTAETLMLAALLHDVGKPETTEEIEGRIRSYNHHRAGKIPAKHFMKQIKRNRNTINTVLPLIEEHLFLTFCPDPTHKAIRRLSVRLHPATIEILCYLIEADMKAQYADKKRLSGIQVLKDKAEELRILDSAPAPLLTGKMLLKKGLAPGKKMGKILDSAYQAQIEGDFSTKKEALDWFKNNLSRFN